MSKLYYDTEPAQGYNQTDSARSGDAVSPSPLCGKPFDHESARFGDPDDACEVAGG